MTSGFSPFYAMIPVYWRWVSFLNPLAYILEGLVINEFRGGGTVTVEGETVDGMTAVFDLFNIPRCVCPRLCLSGDI